MAVCGGLNWCVAQESNLVADELKASDDAGSAVSAFDFGETLAKTQPVTGGGPSSVFMLNFCPHARLRLQSGQREVWAGLRRTQRNRYAWVRPDVHLPAGVRRRPGSVLDEAGFNLKDRVRFTIGDDVITLLHAGSMRTGKHSASDNWSGQRCRRARGYRPTARNGHMLLAGMRQWDFARFLGHIDSKLITTHTIVNNDRLRSQGYALVDEILAPRLRTITVPITNFRDDVAAAMNVSVHAGRLPALIKIQVELAVML
jgi:hypothetical protein